MGSTPIRIFCCFLLHAAVAFGQSDSTARQILPGVRNGTRETQVPAPIENPFRQSIQIEDPPRQFPETTDPVRKGDSATFSSISPTSDQISRQVEIVTKAADLDEVTRLNLLQQLKLAQDSVQAASDSAAKVAKYATEIQQAPKLTVEIKNLLAQSPTEPTVAVPAEAQLPQLEQWLTQAETRLNEFKAELVKRETDLKRRRERQAELIRSTAETTQSLTELRKSPQLPAANETPLAKTVRLMQQAALQVALESQLEQYQLESQRFEAVAELAPLQRDLAKRQVTFAEKEVTAWRKIVAEVRKAESLRQAEEARHQLEKAHPALRQLAERNAALAEQRRHIAASIEKAAADLQEINQQLTQLKADFDKLQEKVQVAGLSKTIGMLLRKQRADLHTLAAPRERIRFIEQELPSAQLTLIELEDERSMLGDVEHSVAQVVEKLDETAHRETLTQTATSLLETTCDLLDKSIYEYNAYLKELGELELSSRRLIAETNAYEAFIDKHVLWIRSAEPFGTDDLERAGKSLMTFADPSLWLLVGKQTVAGLVRQPAQGAIALLLVLVLLVMRQRMWNRLHRLCNVETGNTTLKFLPTLEALLLVFVASSVWPCLMWCAGWWLESSHESTKFSSALAHGLQRGAAFLWLFHLAVVSARSNGIGESHFGWHASSTKVARANLFWLGTLGIPSAVAVTLLDAWDDGQSNESLGRLAFTIGMLVTAMVMHNVFRQKKGMLQEALARDPNGWLNRVRMVGYTAGTGIPCILAVLAAAGYYYSARQVAIRFELTVLTVLGLLVANGLATRWLLVQRRNLAIRQSRERRQSQTEQVERNAGRPEKTEARTERSESNTERTESRSSPVPIQDLSRIQSQLQYLMRYGATLVVLVVSWYVWSDVLPALRILDRVVLWTSRTTVIEEVPDARGELQRRTINKEVATTLTHGLLAALLIAGTVVLGKNLPAVLEVTILERLPIDHGGRHAAVIMLRYLVFLTGLFFVFRTMSVSWSSVQWLAAAMTVGLGFGLQEIFANLVSGLIILFERPVRVGDLVTVNGVTGTVTRMQIRATTITDGDRREMIVPNKKFITEDVINWTLSDPISRVTISVGIAYGSDTVLAKSILMRLANDHPLVMAEPAPLAMFHGFGESTLDFSLHVFIATRAVYADVVHELHTSIDREFRAAGIEMAYPQRDVNIRSINPDILPTIAASRPKAA